MLTFPNVTPEVFALVLDQLRTEVTVTPFTAREGASPAWIIQGNGITAVASHSGDTAQVRVDHKPFYVSTGMIESKIRDAITLAQQAVAKAGGGTAA